MNTAIIVDLDGTLCNARHRVKYVEGKYKDWIAFYDASKDDKVNHWCASIINLYASHSGTSIILLTGRPNNYRVITEKWLHTNKIIHDMLLMRKAKDYRSDIEIKEEIYNEYIKNEYDILFAIDDRTQVVKMWRDLGITCLQCAEGNY